MRSIDDAGATQPSKNSEDSSNVGGNWTPALIPVALATLERIRRLWHILFGHPWFAMRYPGDEGVYQRLRTAVLFQIGPTPECNRARQVAGRALPGLLLTSEDLLSHCEESQAFFETGFQSLEAVLIQLALSQGTNPDAEIPNEIFATYDNYLDRLEPVANRTYEDKARSLGLSTSTKPPHGAAGRADPGQVNTNRAQERAAQRGDRARQLRADGLTIKEIARQLGCASRTVQNDLAKAQ